MIIWFGLAVLWFCLMGSMYGAEGIWFPALFMGYGIAIQWFGGENVGMIGLIGAAIYFSAASGLSIWRRFHRP